MSNLAATIRTAIPTVLSTLAANFGLQFNFSGQPSTDGQVVNLGPVPMHATKDDADLIYSTGYHEIGHCIFSDFDCFKAYTEAAPKAARQLLNAIEDPRSDAEMVSKYPGYRGLLERSNAQMESRGMCRKGDQGFLDSLGMYLIGFGYTTLLKSVFWQAELDRLRAQLVGFSSEALADAVDTLCGKRFPELTSTQDARDMTDELLDIVRQHLPPPSEQESESDQTGSDSKEDDNQKDENTDNQQSDSGESDEEQSDSGDGKDGADDTDASDGDGDAGDGSNDGQPTTSGNTAADEQAINEWLEAQANGQELGADTAFDVEKLFEELCEHAQDLGLGATSDDAGLGYAPEHIPDDLARYNALANQGDSRRVKNELRKLFERSSKPRRVRSRKGKRLNYARAPLWATGYTKIWNRTLPADQMDVALSILIDFSGSMQLEQRDDIATIACAAIGEACEGLTDVEVIAFSNGQHVIKDRMEKLDSKTKARIGGLSGFGYSTNLSGGLHLACSRLLGVQQKNRCLIVITDGQANDPTRAKTIASAFEHNGIRLIGLGIDTPAVKQVFTHADVITAASLPNVLSQLVRRVKIAA